MRTRRVKNKHFPCRPPIILSLKSKKSEKNKAYLPSELLKPGRHDFDSFRHSVADGDRRVWCQMETSSDSNPRNQQRKQK